MKVTEQDVSYVADLANLELTADERVRLVKDLNSILEYIDRLNELDTSNVAPMAQISERSGEEQATGETSPPAQREDVVVPSLPHQEALSNAPEASDLFFQVPKVIEK